MGDPSSGEACCHLPLWPLLTPPEPQELPWLWESSQVSPQGSGQSPSSLFWLELSWANGNQLFGQALRWPSEGTEGGKHVLLLPCHQRGEARASMCTEVPISQVERHYWGGGLSQDLGKLISQ